MNPLAAFEAFAAAHPYLSHLLVGLVATYVLANLAVWPPPKNPQWRAVWSVLVRSLIKTWNVYGGEWKLPGTVVPEPPPLPLPAIEPPPVPAPEVPRKEADTLRPPPLPHDPDRAPPTPKDGPLLPPAGKL